MLFVVFHTIPVLAGHLLQLHQLPRLRAVELRRASNYIELFKDPRVLQAYGFSFLFAGVATILMNIVSLAIAMGLNAKIKCAQLLRGVYFVPTCWPILVVGYVFQFLFSNSLPEILQARHRLLATTSSPSETGRGSAIVILAVWQACAFTIIIYLSGLQTIPHELYEAASIDGAPPWRQFRIDHVPADQRVLHDQHGAVASRASCRSSTTIVALTNGGPGTATESVTLLIFRGGFPGGEFAYQTANAVIFFIVITIVSLFQFRVLQRREADF